MEIIDEDSAEKAIPLNLFAKITPEIENLTQKEEDHLQQVLKKLKRLQQIEEARSNKVAKTLEKSVSAFPPLQPSTEEYEFFCKLCNSLYFPLFNPVCMCSGCSCRLCKKCSVSYQNGTLILCPVCRKDYQEESLTGHWFPAINTKWQSGFVTLKRTLKRYNEKKQLTSENESIHSKDVLNNNPKHGKSSISSASSTVTTTAIIEVVPEEKVEIPNDNDSIPNVDITDGRTNSITSISSKQSTSIPDLNTQRVSIISEVSSNKARPLPNTFEDETPVYKEIPPPRPTRLPKSHPVVVNVTTETNHNNAYEYDSKDSGITNSPTNSVRELPLFLSAENMGGSQLSVASSMYSDGASHVDHEIPVSGEIQFKLHYDDEKAIFTIHIEECRNLAQYAAKRISSAYVKTYLLPDKTKASKRKTKTEHVRVNTKFGADLTYTITKDSLYTRILWISVYHSVKVGYNIFLGEVIVPISPEILGFYETGDQWHNLQAKAPKSHELGAIMDKGELVVSLKYVPGAKKFSGKLQVWIKEARNVISSKPSGASNPFCRLLLQPDKRSRQKTNQCYATVNPKWNQMIEFLNVPSDELFCRSLEITIWDRSKFVGNSFLGGVKLNLGTGYAYNSQVPWMNARGLEIAAWTNMISSHNIAYETVLPLRANMD